jgi:hypothetical protein
MNDLHAAAREAAARLVTVGEFAPNPKRPHETWPWLFVGATPVAELYGDGGVEFTTDVRVAFADALAAFAQRALSCAPPGPVSERLTELAESWDKWETRMRLAEAREYVAGLRAVIRRQQAVIDDMSLDGLKAVADAARVRGMEEMRRLYEDWFDATTERIRELYGVKGTLPPLADMVSMIIAGEIARREEAPR